MDPFATRDDGSAKDPAAYRAAIQKDPVRLKALAEDPALSAAVLGGDANAMQAMLRKARAPAVPRDRGGRAGGCGRGEDSSPSRASGRRFPRAPRAGSHASPAPRAGARGQQPCGRHGGGSDDDLDGAKCVFSARFRALSWFAADAHALAVRAKCTVPKDSVTAYEEMNKNGLQYGPAFRLLTDIHIMDHSASTAAAPRE